MHDIKNIILQAWVNAKNEHERGQILEQIEAARSEIRIELLWSEPELRSAIALLEGKLTAIMCGKYDIQDINPYVMDGQGYRTAPMASHAGYIDMLLALRAAHKSTMLAELHEWSNPHACRIHAAQIASGCPARPINGFTGYVAPLDPSSVECPICRAPIGDKCKIKLLRM